MLILHISILIQLSMKKYNHMKQKTQVVLFYKSAETQHLIFESLCKIYDYPVFNSYL